MDFLSNKIECHHQRKLENLHIPLVKFWEKAQRIYLLILSSFLAKDMPLKRSVLEKLVYFSIIFHTSIFQLVICMPSQEWWFILKEREGPFLLLWYPVLRELHDNLQNKISTSICYDRRHLYPSNPRALQISISLDDQVEPCYPQQFLMLNL